jgi:hypothetical protein
MTTTLNTPLPPTNDRLTGRAFVTSQLFDRLVRRIVTDGELDQDLAERIVDQTIAFLMACARNTSAPLAPSELVDVGWHAFLLHTHEYAGFCREVAGRFLHHVPSDPHDPATGRAACDTLTRTVATIEEAGFVVDHDLWTHQPANDCTGCHNGCHDDPPPPCK